MITSQDCFKKYGNPKLENNLVVWIVPKELQVGKIPKKIYCNKDMVTPLTVAFGNLISEGIINELETWDGCFNIRPMRELNSPSIHSWACAIDVNASKNQLNSIPTLSQKFVSCFVKAGFDWGGTWKRKDGMHFQLSNI